MSFFIKDLKATHGINLKYARCDEIGRNDNFERAYKQEGRGIQFKYTMPNTPEEDNRVKWKFATLLNMAHAMLNTRKFLLF